MNILYCGDRNIEDGLIISVLSLLKNVQEELKIYVLTMEFNNRQKEYKGVPDLIINILDEKVKSGKIIIKDIILNLILIKKV